MKKKKFPKPEMWPVGTRVAVRLDSGHTLITTTRSLPWQLGHGQWVVSLQGITGGFDCERIKKDEEGDRL